MLGDDNKLGARTKTGRLLPLRGVACATEAATTVYSHVRSSIVNVVNKIVLLTIFLLNSNYPRGVWIEPMRSVAEQFWQALMMGFKVLGVGALFLPGWGMGIGGDAPISLFDVTIVVIE